MTSQNTLNPWDFTQALDLLHAFSRPRPLELADSLSVYPLSPSSSSSDSLSGSPKRRGTLGNFDRVFRKLNKLVITIGPLDTHAVTLDDGSSTSDDETTPPTTPLECDAQNFKNLISTKEVRWTDQVEDTAGTGCHKRKRSLQGPADRQNLRSSGLKRRVALEDLEKSENTREKYGSSEHQRNRKNSKSQKSDVKAASAESIFESEADENSSDWWLAKSHYEASRDGTKNRSNLTLAPSLPSAKPLLPSWVTPSKAQAKLWQSPVCIDSTTIKPMLYLTRHEKKARLIRRLQEKFGVSALEHFDLPRSLLQYGGNIADDGIHVFVDSSNISIGFYDALKLARGLPIRTHTKRAPLSFHSLALIMERGRDIARRVLVGSSDRDGVLPGYMREAARCGYEVNSLNRVEKFKENRPSGKKSRSGNGYGTSGQSSGSETPMSGTKKVTEQGVDEILHMKMLESIVDSPQPSTIVLATGDAAEAEFSGGFLKNVERALSKGWKVELVAWGHSMSYAYRSQHFLEKWKDQFMIIDLDEFSEELLGAYIAPSYHPDARYMEPGEAVDDDFGSDVDVIQR
jgi:hypothetical protein